MSPIDLSFSQILLPNIFYRVFNDFMAEVSIDQTCTGQFNLRKLGVTLAPDLFKGTLVMVKSLLFRLISATNVAATGHFVE
jgi:hypothetical protein